MSFTDDFTAAALRFASRHNLDRPDFRAALIDMDGVLYDSMPYHTAAWHRMMTDCGVDCTREEFYLYEGMTGKATINLIWQRVFGSTLPDEEVKRLYAVKSDLFRSFPEPDAMDGAKEMLDTLIKSGIKRVLVTGSAQSSLLKKLSADYPGAFHNDMRITALDVVKGKPHPEPYLRGLEKANVDARHAMVVENAPLGVEAGHAAGCFTVALTTGPVPPESLIEAGADIVLPSMREFANCLSQFLATHL